MICAPISKAKVHPASHGDGNSRSPAVETEWRGPGPDYRGTSGVRPSRGPEQPVQRSGFQSPSQRKGRLRWSRNSTARINAEWSAQNDSHGPVRFPGSDLLPRQGNSAARVSGAIRAVETDLAPSESAFGGAARCSRAQRYPHNAFVSFARETNAFNDFGL